MDSLRVANWHHLPMNHYFDNVFDMYIALRDSVDNSQDVMFADVNDKNVEELDKRLTKDSCLLVLDEREVFHFSNRSFDDIFVFERNMDNV